MNKSNLSQINTEFAQLKFENEQLKNANKLLSEKLAAALDGTGLVIWEQDVPTGKLTVYNQTFGSMCGYQPHELEATVESWENNLHPDDKEFVLAAFNDHLNGKSLRYEVEHRMLHKEGAYTWVSDIGRVIEVDDEGNPLRMMGTHEDITTEKEYELSLAKYANLDPLTSLLNRKALYHSFKLLTQSSRYDGGAFLFIDLDDFKKVNDQYGHKVGDKLLLCIAQLLSSLAPKSTKVARFGGDEFIILCDTSNKKVLTMLAHTLLSAFEKEIPIDGISFIVGLSIGVCCFSGTEASFDQIYEKADEAMYQSKNNGKNNCSILEIEPIT